MSEQVRNRHSGASRSTVFAGVMNYSGISAGNSDRQQSLRAVMCWLLAVLLAGSAAADPGDLRRLDARLDALVPPAARAVLVASGFQWLEGPVWDKRNGYLLFTDIPANAVYRWTPGKGTELHLQPAGYTGDAPYTGREPGANGLAFDAQGRLLLCQHGDRRIARLEADGRFTVLAGRWQGRRLNSPNDLVVARDGTVYFTDPPFGLPQTFDDPARELAIQGVYRLSPEGELQLLLDSLRAPNGIALSPDERTLYVSDVDPARPALWAFKLDADGRAGGGRVLFDARPWQAGRPGGPDGIEVDAAGNLIAVGPGGVFFLTPQGELLGILETGVATSNVAWGEDGSVLFITAGTGVYRLPLVTGSAPGAAP
jgi:gluconolactonase